MSKKKNNSNGKIKLTNIRIGNGKPIVSLQNVKVKKDGNKD